MITLLTGIPGSGKSYMAVEHVYRMKDQSKVLHNIEGFKLGVSLDEYSLLNNMKKIDVFRKSWHEKNDTLHGWTLIIDEAAELFPRSMKDTDVIGFFDYHRHYGIDIFLITQDIKKVTPDITCLAESHYRAASGASNPLPGFLIYQQIVGGESVARKYLRKRKEVFALYKSTNDHSSGSINIGKIYFAAAVVAAAVALFALKSWISSFRPEDVQPVVLVDNRKGPEKSLIKSTRTKPPGSLPSAIGGNPYNVSTVMDHSGEYVVFCGNFYRRENFPYPLVKSRTGLVALLPSDALAYVSQYEQKLEASLKSSSSPQATEPNDKGDNKTASLVQPLANPAAQGER